MSVPAPLPQPLIPLHAANVELRDVGGKAVNLTRLARAGFPVPTGFTLPTQCYRDFVESNALSSRIRHTLAVVDSTEADALESASHQIRTAFGAGRIDPGLASALEVAWRWLGARPVAVRSSATAEDLPQASFAGQQDTFLNVIGGKALAETVMKCWSSLWTARAISYRERNGIEHDQVALAVVVQVMVPAEASGVMFTSNPVSGLRSEVVIDATLGLGEALVSGLVEPDHYVVAKGKREIIGVEIGSKAIALHGDPEGGLRKVGRGHHNQQALPDPAIRELARLGGAIEELFGFPQDVEWAWSMDDQVTRTDRDPPGEGGLWIVQSRPITSLFPVPEGLPAEQVRVLFSFGAVQGMLDPMTPLGQDALRLIFAGGGSLFGSRADHTSQGVIHIAGERLWGDITGPLRHPLGARAIPKIFQGVEPGSSAALEELIKDPKVGAGAGPFRPLTMLRVAGFVLARLWRVLKIARHPEHKADLIRANYQAALTGLQHRSAEMADRMGSLERAIALYRELENAFVYAVPEIALGAFAGLFPLAPLTVLSRHLTGSNDLALQVTRGLPHNVTTEMDLALWQHARAIKGDGPSKQAFARHSAGELSAQFQAGSLPEVAREELDRFLEAYGMRGVGEIDIGRPRWREDPTPVIQTIHSYFQIDDPDRAPDAVFQRGREAAETAVGELVDLARQTAAGGLKATLIRAASRRVRALAGLRESPKFYIIQVMGVIRGALLEAGEDLAREGMLARADDIFYLYLNELEEIADGHSGGWLEIVAARRESYHRERLRRQIPRILLSDGRAFYEGILSGEDREGRLRGSPVSPGIAEGAVRVVRDPHHARLQPGEILVCPGTDPAWTPLFLAAGGLVMEVGGMMTHGAIVAREYGIPAVVGVDRATDRLQTGQRIRVDGSSGVIQPLE